MDARSKPYFFAFDTKVVPGKVLAHCVRFETMEIDNTVFDGTTFTLLGADIESDRRIRMMVDIVRRAKY